MNTRALYSMRACGQGYAGKLASLMNLPRTITSNDFDKIVGRLIIVIKTVAEKTIQDACSELREMMMVL